PPGKSAVNAIGFGRGEAPELASGRSLDRHDFQRGRGGVNYAVDHERVALNLRGIGPGLAGVISPREFEAADILRGNLLERRVVAGAFVAEVSRPVVIAGGELNSTKDGQESEG